MTFAAKAHQARGRYPWAIPFRWGPGTYGPVRALVCVVAVVTATGFLSAAIISVFIIWLPVALLSLAFGRARIPDVVLHGGSRLEHSRPRRGLPQNLVALSQSIKAQ